MKAERNVASNTLRGTLLLRMANSRTLAKHRDRHPEGSLPSSLANRYFDCQKTKRAGLKLPMEAARSFNSLEFAFEIWERESAPAELLPDMTPIYGRFLAQFTAKIIDR